MKASVRAAEQVLLLQLVLQLAQLPQVAHVLPAVLVLLLQLALVLQLLPELPQVAHVLPAALRQPVPQVEWE